MAAQFVPVQPGDVIPSDLFDRLLAEFDKPRDRVTVLEGAPSVGEVGIQALVPSSGVVRTGNTLGVFGFGVCRVSIDEVPVPDLTVGGGDRQLVFDIPAPLEATIPAAGRATTLQLQAVFTGVQDPTLWAQRATFTDPAGASLQGGWLALAANESRRFKLALDKVPDTPDAGFQVGVRGAEASLIASPRPPTAR